MVEIMMDKAWKTFLSNNTIQTKISDMSEDIEKQVGWKEEVNIFLSTDKSSVLHSK